MRTFILLSLVACALLSACSPKENPLSALPDLSAVRANLTFTCSHEADRLPPLDPEADQLFKYGRYLQKKEGPKDFDAVARYYRIAAAHGHYKANDNLQQLVSQGFTSSLYSETESIQLATQLIEQGVPIGYYAIGYYLHLGYGLKQNEDMSLRYFRKAADLGNPAAQFYVADLLSPRDKAPDIARQMLQCAMEQGHGKAANILGIDLKNSSLYPEAVKAFQKGVEAGDTLSALKLEHSFSGPPSTDGLDYLALPNDPERSRRYKLIGEFIDNNEGRNPKVPDIDHIVPLPPAKLPAWDGTFQWQKEQDAAVQPKQPSEDLIKRLAKDKNLDPATGLKLPEPIKAAARLPLGTGVYSDQICPESGLWAVLLCGGDRARPSTLALRKGEVFPRVTHYYSRNFPFMNTLLGMPKEDNAMALWELKAYSDKA